jgi:hypothetical protein
MPVAETRRVRKIRLIAKLKGPHSVDLRVSLKQMCRSLAPLRRHMI